MNTGENIETPHRKAQAWCWTQDLLAVKWHHRVTKHCLGMVKSFNNDITGSGSYSLWVLPLIYELVYLPDLADTLDEKQNIFPPTIFYYLNQNFFFCFPYTVSY